MKRQWQNTESRLSHPEWTLLLDEKDPLFPGAPACGRAIQVSPHAPGDGVWMSVIPWGESMSHNKGDMGRVCPPYPMLLLVAHFILPALWEGATCSHFIDEETSPQRISK